MPHRFDKNGHLLPPEPTPLQAARIRIEELERDLLNLVCRIHRDGGHYIAKYGEAKAIADADTVAAQNNADLDALQADNAELVAALEKQVAHDKAVSYERCPDCDYGQKCSRESGCQGIKNHSPIANTALAKVRKP